MIFDFNSSVKQAKNNLLVALMTVIFSSHALARTQQDRFNTYVIHTYGGADLIGVVTQELEGTNSKVSSYQDQLVLYTTPAGYAQVQQLLSQIDRVPQSLNVSIRVGKEAESIGNINQSQIILGGRIGQSNHMAVQAIGRFDNHRTKSQKNSLYQVRTLSGKSASIGIGTIFSLAETYIQQYPRDRRTNGHIVIQGQRLVPTVKGMSVTPRTLPNGQIQIQLKQQSNQLTDSQVVPVRSQWMSNTIIVQRGQWITIGTINNSVSTQYNGWSGSGRQINQVVYPIQLKVD